MASINTHTDDLSTADFFPPSDQLDHSLADQPDPSPSGELPADQLGPSPPDPLHPPSTDQLTPPPSNLPSSAVQLTRPDAPDNEQDAGPGYSLDEEFTCGICFELMVLPTSLNCGHSFCRPCLASWAVASRRTECPSCRQRFYGQHNVNFVIKSSMEKAYGAKIRERMREVRESATVRQQLRAFDHLTSQAAQPERSARAYSLDRLLWHAEHVAGDAWKLMRTMLTIGVIASTIFFLTGYLFADDMDLLIQKPFYKWTPGEVEIWLRDLGPWTETELLPAFRKYNIDGRLLLALNTEDIDSMFNFSQQMYKTAFSMYIHSVRQAAISPPADLWEFKHLHPLWACILVIALKHHPRSIFLFMYLFDYDNTFLPFIHSAVQGRRISNLNLYNIKMSDPSVVQLTDFVLESVFVPFVLLMKFAWSWISVHWFIVPSVMVVCVEQTVSEARAVCRAALHISRWRPWEFLRSYVNGICYYALPVFLWPVLPRFLYDLVFNVTLLWHVGRCLAVLLMSTSAAVLAVSPLFRR